MASNIVDELELKNNKSLKEIELSLRAQSHTYPILIGENLLNKISNILLSKQTQQVCIVTNQEVAKWYLEPLVIHLKQHLANVELITIAIKDGESQKSLDSFSKIVNRLIEEQFRRNSCLLALGGGVIGDLTGFVAATYYRGINFIQLPTTLLAMVDSSVGGKTAINHEQGKNLIGAFYQPEAVISDINTLKTLPKREFLAGISEIIKVALVYDRKFFAWLYENKDVIMSLEQESLVYMIEKACSIKAEIVSQDEQEKGIRVWLNLGHTFAHAIEKEVGFGNILHGEAVAIGIRLAAELSYQKLLIDELELNKITSIFKMYGLKTSIPKGLSANQLSKAMLLDKKNIDKNIRLILPKTIGKVVIDTSHDIHQVESFLNRLIKAGC